MSELRGDDLAYATLDHIREHPEAWRQEIWYCTTQACFAGRAILLAHGEDEYRYQIGLPRNSETIQAYAAGLLGWTPTQAKYVFRCLTENFTVLERHVKEVLNNEVK